MSTDKKTQIMNGLDELALFRAMLDKEATDLHKSMDGLNKMPEKEDMQQICNLLLPALQATKRRYDLVSLIYINVEKGKEIVVAEYDYGGKQEIDVSGDSGIEMIRDIILKLR